MKTHRTIAAALVALVAVTTILSCARAPEEQMAAASQAVQRAASEPDVQEYAPQSIDRARQLLSEMETAAEDREYDTARSLAEQAQEAAEQAITDAETVKSRARDRAENTVAAAESTLAEAREAVSDARNAEGIRFDFSAAANELERISEIIDDAEADIAAEEFAGAQSAAENARSSLSDLMRRVSNAVQAASRK